MTFSLGMSHLTAPSTALECFHTKHLQLLSCQYELLLFYHRLQSGQHSAAGSLQHRGLQLPQALCLHIHCRGRGRLSSPSRFASTPDNDIYHDMSPDSLNEPIRSRLPQFPPLFFALTCADCLEVRSFFPSSHSSFSLCSAFLSGNSRLTKSTGYDEANPQTRHLSLVQNMSNPALHFLLFLFLLLFGGRVTIRP